MPGFFDRVREGIDKGVAVAGAKSKELIETQQVRSKIGELEGQKQAVLLELGNLVYGMAQADNFEPEPIKARAEAINALNSQIAEQEEELRQIRIRSEASVAARPEAPAAPPPPAPQAPPQETPQAAPEATPAVCECGTVLEEGAKFCPNCGKRAF